MRFSDVRSVWVERPAFSKWAIVHIYYLPKYNENQEQAGEQEFKVWFESKMFNKKEESSFLSSLAALSPNIE